MAFFKDLIKKKIIGTQHEWESYFENILYVLDKNLRTYQPRNLLDVGCNIGNITIQIGKYFNLNANDIHGVDINDQYIASARKIFKAERVDVESEPLPYNDNTFDLVICSQLLEHLKDYRKVIDDIIRVSKKNGYIILGIPNLAHLINRIYLVFGIQPLCINIESFHLRGFTHKAFIRMLNSIEKIRLIDCSGSLMYPLPFAIAKVLSKYLVGLSAYTCYLLEKIK